MAENSNTSNDIPNTDNSASIDLDMMNEQMEKLEKMSKEEYLNQYGQQLYDELEQDVFQADLEAEMNAFEDENAKKGIQSSFKNMNIDEGEPCLNFMYTGNCLYMAT